jgi:hypothetical protein
MYCDGYQGQGIRERDKNIQFVWSLWVYEPFWEGLEEYGILNEKNVIIGGDLNQPLNREILR